MMDIIRLDLSYLDSHRRLDGVHLVRRWGEKKIRQITWPENSCLPRRYAKGRRKIRVRFLRHDSLFILIEILIQPSLLCWSSGVKESVPSCAQFVLLVFWLAGGNAGQIFLFTCTFWHSLFMRKTTVSFEFCRREIRREGLKVTVGSSVGTGSSGLRRQIQRKRRWF